jgi:hypothetical protein
MKTSKLAPIIMNELNNMAQTKVTIVFQEVTKFLDTIEALRNTEIYGNTITVGDSTFQISDYQIDSRLGKLVGPRAVLFQPTDLFSCKDVRVHQETGEVMTPAKFIEFQWKVAKLFKKQPNLTAMSLQVVGLDSASVLCKDGKVAVFGDQNTYGVLPADLTVVDSLLEDEAFSQSEDEYMRRFVINMLSAYSAKQQQQ